MFFDFLILHLYQQHLFFTLFFTLFDAFFVDGDQVPLRDYFGFFDQVVSLDLRK